MEKLLVILMLVLGMLTLLSHGAPSSIAQEGATIISRDECIKQVAEFMAQFEIRDDVKEQLVEAREYYHTMSFYVDPNYRVNNYTEGCQYLHDQVKSIETRVPCYYNATIMGIDETQSIKDVCGVNEGARNVLESEYACFYGLASGAAMTADGVFEEITGRERQWRNFDATYNMLRALGDS